MKKSLLLLIPPLFALSALSHAAPVNLITNGSFEADYVKSGTLIMPDSLVGWTGGINMDTVDWKDRDHSKPRTLPSGTNGIEVRNNDVGQAQNGHNFVELDVHNNSSMYQDIGGLTAGAKYKLSFWYAPRIGTKSNTNTITAKWNDTIVKSVSGNAKYAKKSYWKKKPNNQQNWTYYTVDVTAADLASNKLTFFADGIEDCLGGSLDNVSLFALSNPTPPPVNPVPLPASSLLFAPALLGFIGLRRKAKKTVA